MSDTERREAIIESFCRLSVDSQESLVYDLYQIVQTTRAKEIAKKEQEIADLKKDILRMDETIDGMKGGRERVIKEPRGLAMTKEEFEALNISL